MLRVPSRVRKDKVSLKGIIRQVYKGMGRAIVDYGMISDGDRILVGISGGIGSFLLLKLFQMRKERVPIDFDIIACFVDKNFINADKNILIEYFKSCGVEYVLGELAFDKDAVNSFWCSCQGRKILFKTARDNNCNKIALGHNLNDIIETTLLNLFFGGEISTMKPKIELFGGEIWIIRPLCYIEKENILSCASKFSFPSTHHKYSCDRNPKRQILKDIVKRLENDCPFVKKNVFRALGRVKKDYLL